jgi:hypothetical protein
MTVLVIVTLSYLAVTSVEYTLSSPDPSALLGVPTPATTEGASPWAVPCATFPDMTCPARNANPAAEEPTPPTF